MTLTDAEIARLGHDLPDLSTWGADMLVPFPARRLRHASVVWINRRWFRACGLDASSAEVDARLCHWLIDEFAHVVPRPEDTEASFAAGGREWFADRYGGTGWVPHGGSGRAGIAGRFQAKGIGVTPLVGRDADWLHAHGCLWLEEAIRETICAEIACAEFPHSGVPVLAILDTGLNAEMPPGQLGERRAILIRPCVIRPSHLQRAPLFKPFDAGSAAQPADARRTRDAVRTFFAAGAGWPGLIQLARRVAEQIAFGLVHRLDHGGYFSSNLGMDGELLDFGSMHASADWRREPVAGGSADAFTVFSAVLASLRFYLYKHAAEHLHTCTSAAASDENLLAYFAQQHDRAVVREIRRYWALDAYSSESTDRMIAAMRRVIARGATLALDKPAAGPLAADLSAIDGALHEAADPAQRRRAWAAASRHSLPRALLDRTQLQAVIHAQVCNARTTTAPPRDTVQNAIRHCVTLSRRCWPRLPRNLIVLAQHGDDDSDVLLCVDPGSGEHALWIEAVSADATVVVFGQRLDTATTASFCVDAGSSSACLRIPCAPTVEDAAQSVLIGTAVLHLPPFALRYAEPDWIAMPPPDSAVTP